MLYGTETWIGTKASEHLISTAQRRMEHRMVDIFLLDKKTNSWLHGVTKNSLLNITDFAGVLY
ncbi:hypothetical protein OESDEN_01313 [Oesophagostomum dentatum]|uniref:Uncharacterized protein n=1 Tax=Oesophagostomum dentatum TaxID=61180 RepID=A0A0B1TMF6_OESDE|nr:hypothetical protein OESDEN_01313 [Oesophagostomum dentatum]